MLIVTMHVFLGSRRTEHQKKRRGGGGAADPLRGLNSKSGMDFPYLFELGEEHPSSLHNFPGLSSRFSCPSCDQAQKQQI